MRPLKQIIKDMIHEQTVDWSSVVPRQNFAKGRFFLTSPAGILIYKPKTEADVSRFRDRWIATFEAIAKIPDVKLRTDAYLKFYKVIRSNERITYRANARTRWISFLSN